MPNLVWYSKRSSKRDSSLSSGVRIMNLKSHHSYCIAPPALSSIFVSLLMLQNLWIFGRNSHRYFALVLEQVFIVNTAQQQGKATRGCMGCFSFEANRSEAKRLQPPTSNLQPKLEDVRKCTLRFVSFDNKKIKRLL